MLRQVTLSFFLFMGGGGVYFTLYSISWFDYLFIGVAARKTHQLWCWSSQPRQRVCLILFCQLRVLHAKRFGLDGATGRVIPWTIVSLVIRVSFSLFIIHVTDEVKVVNIQRLYGLEAIRRGISKSKQQSRLQTNCFCCCRAPFFPFKTFVKTQTTTNPFPFCL